MRVNRCETWPVICQLVTLPLQQVSRPTLCSCPSVLMTTSLLIGDRLRLIVFEPRKLTLSARAVLSCSVSMMTLPQVAQLLFAYREAQLAYPQVKFTVLGPFSWGWWYALLCGWFPPWYLTDSKRFAASTASGCSHEPAPCLLSTLESPLWSGSVHSSIALFLIRGLRSRLVVGLGLWRWMLKTGGSSWHFPTGRNDFEVGVVEVGVKLVWKCPSSVNLRIPWSEEDSGTWLGSAPFADELPSWTETMF